MEMPVVWTSWLKLSSGQSVYLMENCETEDSPRLVQSEPRTSLIATMQPINTSIQSSAIEILQAIVSRGEIDHDLIETVEAVTITKLYFSIHTSQLDLQNKWLHLLHSVISVSTANLESPRTVGANVEGTATENGTQQERGIDSSIRYPMNPLMIQTLVDGISMRSNRPVLQHWLDFILMAVPQFQPTLQAVVTPLNDCLCRQVLSSLGDLLRAAASRQDYTEDMPATVSDAEIIMLLNGMERLVLLSLAYTSNTVSADDDSTSMDKSVAETSGLLGYVSNVFGTESNPSNHIEQLTVSPCILAYQASLITPFSRDLLVTVLLMTEYVSSTQSGLH